MTLLIFSDLDGSLMDHESYSIEAARPALQEVASREIPLILNSSKTASEMQAIQSLLALQTPFVSENGAALHLGDGELIEFGPPRERWLQKVHGIREARGYRFEGFEDWSSASISKLTGLDTEQSELAKTRNYSEPILWSDSQLALQEFRSELEKLDLCLLQGGRFLSIQGRFNKSDAMKWMSTEAAKQSAAEPPLVVALGDSPNDTAMLNAADVAVIIKSAKSILIHCPDAKRVIHTRQAGPSGWNEAMSQVFSLFDRQQL